MRHPSLLARVSVICAAMLMAASAFGQDQPKNPQNPPADTTAKPAAPAATPAPAVVHRPPTPKEEADSLLGKEVFGADGSQMGLVTNVLIDRDGHPIALVIDFGGFLGMGSRKIAIDWKLMQFHPGDKNKPVTLSLSKDQLKAAPEYKPDKAALIVHAPTAPTPAGKPAEKPPDKTEQPPTQNGTK